MWAYLGRLTFPRLVLWSYFIWYLVAVSRYFDPTPSLWLNSLGISAIIGTGLVLSTAYSTKGRTALDRWQVFRLYLMPLCVSSFAATIKDHGFVLIFHPTLDGNAQGLGAILTFLALAGLARRFRSPRVAAPATRAVRA